MPWLHFGRKSLGYLYAAQSEAASIWDFESDVEGVIDPRSVFDDSNAMTPVL